MNGVVDPITDPIIDYLGRIFATSESTMSARHKRIRDSILNIMIMDEIIDRESINQMPHSAVNTEILNYIIDLLKRVPTGDFHIMELAELESIRARMREDAAQSAVTQGGRRRGLRSRRRRRSSRGKKTRRY